MLRLQEAKQFLLHEQHGLCAYCQKELTLAQASIEHVIPKSQAPALSTDYHNLVAVCEQTVKDPASGRLHCDKERGDQLLPSLIFYESAQVSEKKNHSYMMARSNGSWAAKHTLSPPIKQQVEVFIEILNLNHYGLMQDRATMLKGILASISATSPNPAKNRFYQAQFDRIQKNPKLPYRQYLLSCLGTKLGLN